MTKPCEARVFRLLLIYPTAELTSLYFPDIFHEHLNYDFPWSLQTSTDSTNRLPRVFIRLTGQSVTCFSQHHPRNYQCPRTLHFVSKSPTPCLQNGGVNWVLLERTEKEDGSCSQFNRVLKWEFCSLRIHPTCDKKTVAGKTKWGCIKTIQLYSNTALNNNTIYKNNKFMMNARPKARHQIPTHD